MKVVDQDRKHDHSDDDSSIIKAAQRCRENRKRLMRRKFLQTEFPEEKARKLTATGEDDEKERIVRFHIRNIVAFERQKLDMEMKRRMEKARVRDQEEEEEGARRIPETSLRFQDSKVSKIGVGKSEPEIPPEFKNRIKKRATER